ncbi:hypothetical protein SCLCIDRAFT_101208, partial [Scleroderma citrinum Foug A]
DNAKNNDAMIRELETLTLDFAGFASHTRCFLHIMNLIAKSLLHQFDAKKATVHGDSEMATLADELANEEAMVDEIEDDNDLEVDNEDGWIDEMEDLTENERIELEESMRPVKLALAKVS